MQNHIHFDRRIINKKVDNLRKINYYIPRVSNGSSNICQDIWSILSFYTVKNKNFLLEDIYSGLE